jgi:hypothetical protein
MQRFPALLLGFWLASVGLGVGAAESAPDLPPRDRFHVYLLIGQSNMAGRGMLDPATAVSSVRVLKYTSEVGWAPGTEPLHPPKSGKGGAGLAASFARAMADAEPDVTIGLIPCAVGGTPLSRWMKGGDLYEKAVNRTRKAMHDGTLKGILWHQGERDSMQEETASTYGDRLSQMVADLRDDLGVGQVPFVAGHLGHFVSSPKHDGKYAYSPVVEDHLTALPGRVPCTAVVDSAGLTAKQDELHFDTPSLREFGIRYAAAMQRLQQSD